MSIQQSMMAWGHNLSPADNMMKRALDLYIKGTTVAEVEKQTGIAYEYWKPLLTKEIRKLHSRNANLVSSNFSEEWDKARKRVLVGLGVA